MKKIISIIIISLTVIAFFAIAIYELYVKHIVEIGGGFLNKLITFAVLTLVYAILFTAFHFLFKLLKWAHSNLFDDNN